MASRAAPRTSALRRWLVWTAGFLAFPIAGLAGTGVAGRVDDPVAAVLGGTVTGLVVGVGQTLAGLGRLDIRRWAPATGTGMGLGLLLGAGTVGYGTSLGELGLMGALTGLLLGPAQALALPPGTRLRWAWAAAMPVLWAAGWTATTLGGIAVDEQFTVFGAYGAVTFSALSGLLLLVLLPDRPGADPTTAPAPLPSAASAPSGDRA
ncbi:hypothetical protein [Modestobacter marinus]|uniref:hypothetical protein n=1 Tax=Modestobacter marinus TaxID=477641 RepID=UPI001C950E5A|nr:hypothetical protein [Modestobacter marinus]